MKKTYIEPSMEVIKVNVSNIIAASTLPIFDEEVDPGEQMGREDDSFANSNVWEQGW